ncbi:MAG TPA: ATP-binding protein [Ilumatobacteraceae bacterium]|nr:ATP-binding protein [Ilumatobacteraceae bacterium]
MEQFDHRSTSMPADRSRVWVPCAAAVVAVTAGGIVLLGFRVANRGVEPAGQNWWLVTWFCVALAYTVVGTALVVRSSRRNLGVCFLVVGGAAVVTAIATQYRGYGSTEDRHPHLPAFAEAATWARPFGEAVLVGLVTWELLPLAWRADRRSRYVRAVALTGVGLVTAARLTDAWPRRWGTNPLEVTAGAALDAVNTADVVGTWLVAIVGAAGVALLGRHWLRERRPDGDPINGWLFAGAAAAWLAIVPSSLDIVDWRLPGRDVVSPLLLLATVPLLVAGATVEALRRSSSPSLEQTSHRVLEWVLLAAGIAVVYTGLVGGLGSMFGETGPTWFLVAATGAIALIAEPARHRTQRLVDHLVYGARDDPLGVVQRVVDHVGADTGDDLLPALVNSLERELRLDAVAIDLVAPGGWQRVASVGPHTVKQREVLLRNRDEVVGRLVVGWTEGPSIRPRDRQILDQLAGPLGLAVSWVRLAADLRRSSVAVVSAREEERRRLRRDLHDGLGPALTGVSLGMRTAMRQLDRSIDAGGHPPPRELLGRLADEIDSVVVELKRIVRDLRPTALDQLGLVGALAEFTRKFDGDLEIHLSLPTDGDSLPAAVEVAVYRIVTEAVTNVVRHAKAASCWLTMVTGATVEIDVIDDGVGIGPHASDGVGLTAMRERASELGGAVRFLANTPCGTHVHVQLPAALP